MMLKKEELKRYHRQIILPELGIAGQQKLKEAKVLMVGAGGLGCPVLQYLVAAGTGCIGIIDDDSVDESNLHRQVLYSPADIGLKKAISAQSKLQVLNPYVQVTAYPERLTGQNIYDIFEQYDLIIDGSDNFPTRYLVNDTCLALNKPLVFGSVFKFEGQVSVFNYQNGPGYRDIFPEAPPEGEAPNCADIGVIGVLPGIVGTFMANEAVKIICGIGEPLSGRLLRLNALDYTTEIFKFNRRKQEKQAAMELNIEGHAALTGAGSNREADEKSVKTGQIESGHLKSDIRSLTSVVPSNASKIPGDKQPDADRESKTGTGIEISIDLLENWLENAPGQVCLVDVRESYEFEDYNIGGINIPLEELVGRMSELPSGKTKIIFCCQSGHRSRQAVQLAKPLLKAQIFSLKDGIYSVPL